MLYMLYMLDTNTCSYIIRRHPLSVEEALMHRTGEGHRACMSIVTYRELRNYTRNKEASERERLRSLIDGLRDRLTYRAVEWNDECDRKFDTLKRAFAKEFPKASLEKRKNDLMIAAHALVLSATVVTNDKDFQRIRRVGGPRLENWYPRGVTMRTPARP